ncbi:MAG: AsmA-like C-terminal domain-containing protein [Alphaproteobacteria bacterium]
MIRRTSIFLLEILAVCTAGLTVLLVLIGLRLWSGPMSLDFLTPHIEEALNSIDPAYKVEVDGTILTWAGWERTLDLRVVGVRVFGAEGSEQAVIPEMSVSLSARGLIRGLIAPTALEIFRPRLSLVRAKGGGFELASGPGVSGAVGKVAGLLSPLVSGLLRAPDPDWVLGYLTRVSVLEADVTIDDRLRGYFWHAPRADIRMFRDREGIRANGVVHLQVAGRRARFDLAGTYDNAAKDLDLEIQFADTDPSHFVALLPFLDPVSRLQVPISGRIGLVTGIEGRINELRFDLITGAGTLRLPEIYDEPVKLKALRTRGRFTQDMRALKVETLMLDFGGPVAEMTAEVSDLNAAAKITANAVLRNFTVADLKRFWPPSLSVNARNWVVKNLHKGRMPEARFSLKAQAAGKDIGDLKVASLAGSFDFSDMSVTYLRGLPPFRGLAGTTRVALDRLDFAVSKGRVLGLRLGQGTISLRDLDTDNDENITVDAVLRGPLRDALEILNRPRLSLLGKLGFSPGKTGGRAAVRLVTRLPLINDVTFEQVQLQAAATLRDISIPNVVGNLAIKGGDASLQLDNHGMKVKGSMMLSGAPASLVWVENFDDQAIFRSRYEVKGTFDAAARRKLGLELGEYLQGPVDVDLSYVDYDRKRGDMSIAADFRKTALTISGLHWKKPKGADGTGRFSLVFGDGLIKRAKDFTIVTGDFRANGTASFAADGKSLRRIRLARMVFGKTDSAAIVTMHDDGGYDINLDGRSFDATPYMEVGDQGRQLPPMRLAFTLNRMWFSTEGYFSKVKGGFLRQGGEWRSIKFDGRVGKGGAFAFRLAPGGKGRRLAIKSSDAGATLRVFGITENITGGQMRVLGEYDDSAKDAPLKGHASVRNYRLIKAPVIAEVLTVAMLTGIPDLLSGPGIGFNRFEAPFVLKDDILHLKDMRAHGNAIGFTADGSIDFKKLSLDLRGTIVPAYSVNSILGNIPVLGTLLTGGKGGGVFAATYKMKGPVKNPKISVNPLATLAPGFLRGLFGIFDSDQSGGSDDKAPIAPEQPAKSGDEFSP